MHPFGVQLHLEEVARARAEWTKAQNEFNTTVRKIMERLLHEAAAARMSPEQVAKAAHLTPTRVRAQMRLAGLNPKMGKTLLAESASKALTENAMLMGVDPEKMDLTSPLAYLPMGNELKQRLEIEKLNRTSGVLGEGFWCSECLVFEDDDYCEDGRCLACGCSKLDHTQVKVVHE